MLPTRRDVQDLQWLVLATLPLHAFLSEIGSTTAKSATLALRLIHDPSIEMTHGTARKFTRLGNLSSLRVRTRPHRYAVIVTQFVTHPVVPDGFGFGAHTHHPVPSDPRGGHGASRWSETTRHCSAIALSSTSCPSAVMVKRHCVAGGRPALSHHW
jgi:hypothetical protein